VRASGTEVAGSSRITLASHLLALGLTAVLLVAVGGPTWRAARVDPVQAMRTA
jgi:ABC-type antimicrobial peptide transport system permease subunit